MSLVCIRYAISELINHKTPFILYCAIINYTKHAYFMRDNKYCTEKLDTFQKGTKDIQLTKKRSRGLFMKIISRCMIIIDWIENWLKLIILFYFIVKLTSIAVRKSIKAVFMLYRSEFKLIQVKYNFWS